MALYVNGEKVGKSQIAAEVEKLRPQYEQVFADSPEKEREEQLQEWSRENVIESVLLRQAADRDVQISDDDIEKAYQSAIAEAGGEKQFYQNFGLSPDKKELVSKGMAAQLRLERLVNKITAGAAELGEKDILKYYEENIDKFTIGEMVHAAHIVKHASAETSDDEIRKQMQQVRDKLDTGADFAELAGECSDCPDNGGELGLFGRGQMVQEFENVVFAMQPGEISDVFQSPFGYHIAKVFEKKAAIPCTLEQVREVIVKELGQQGQQKALEVFIDAEKVKAAIEEK